MALQLWVHYAHMHADSSSTLSSGITHCSAVYVTECVLVSGLHKSITSHLVIMYKQIVYDDVCSAVNALTTHCYAQHLSVHSALLEATAL
jgi:hypothetical protein